ncbi:hypothetical protein Csa_015918 [Cucumis sativus]|uniref:Retrotransposon gag domain-containing protein n=1 Tax=Cucumis sativus TaxID=3659 RepID=A0A0A0K6F9_CUCSA|nr:hypothetical protein Csa_015918 [Cucumis sativus]
MIFKQRDKENMHDTWSRFKRLVKACPCHGIPECVSMEVFYFGLSKDTHQLVNTLFVGGMLRSSYNQIKATLDSMSNNSQEWDDIGFGSRHRGRTKEGLDKSVVVVLQGQMIAMNNLLQSMTLSQVNAANNYIHAVKQVNKFIVWDVAILTSLAHAHSIVKLSRT